LELDLELENIGGPPTEKLSWAQLRDAGKNAMRHGHRWAAYAFLRDATFCVSGTGLDPSAYASVEDQEIGAFMNAASAAQTLGKYRYAGHEFLYAEQSGVLGANSRVLVAERLAMINWRLQNATLAQTYADRALERLDAVPTCPFEGYVYGLHGFLCYQQQEFAEAVPWHQKAYDTFRQRKMMREGANSLLCLADCYHSLGNPKAAVRTLEVALALSEEHSIPHVKALALTLYGVLDQEANRSAASERKLREAQEIAKSLSDRALKFRVDFYLYKHAVAQNRVAAARAIRRRLDKLAVSVPDSIEQIVEFKAMKKSQSS
jgi:tetratricopeptide (TPR) repeat protein